MDPDDALDIALGPDALASLAAMTPSQSPPTSPEGFANPADAKSYLTLAAAQISPSTSPTLARLLTGAVPTPQLRMPTDPTFSPSGPQSFPSQNPLNPLFGPPPSPPAPPFSAVPPQGLLPAPAPTPAEMAFLDTIAGNESQGYSDLSTDDATREQLKGHNRQFSGFDRFPDGSLYAGKGVSTASGRYQFLKKTWNDEVKKLGLKDFSPPNQDIAGWDYAQQIYMTKTGRNLDSDLGDSSRHAQIVQALGAIWPSLPGGSQAGAQRTVSDFTDAYQRHLQQRLNAQPY